jgi:hypothetical protein
VAGHCPVAVVVVEMAVAVEDKLLSFHQRPGEGQRDFKQRLRSFLRKE